MSTGTPDIGVVGGTGLYSLISGGREKSPRTPYGEASAPVTVGELAGRQMAFLPRHGQRHQLAPHTINYRANLWALHQLGVRRVIGVGAVGSLDAAIEPGTLVVPDQLVDRTARRTQTYFDGEQVAHAPFADPYCAAGRKAAVQAAGAQGWPAGDGGTQVVIEGPRFSTRAESQWYARQGWSLIGMTSQPEVSLARELGQCYIPLCVVTDLDAGLGAGGGVTQEEVMGLFSSSLERLQSVLSELVGGLPGERSCNCAELRPTAL